MSDLHKQKFLLKYGKVEDQPKRVMAVGHHLDSASLDVRHVARWLGTTTNVHPEVFNILSTNPRFTRNYTVRESIVGHPETPKHVIDNIISDHSFADNWNTIPHRPDVTKEQLIKIAHIGIDDGYNEQAGRAALENPKAPKEILDKYSHHPDPYVAAAVAYNPNSTEEHLKTIEYNHYHTAGKDAVDTVRRRRERKQ